MTCRKKTQDQNSPLLLQVHIPSQLERSGKSRQSCLWLWPNFSLSAYSSIGGDQSNLSIKCSLSQPDAYCLWVGVGRQSVRKRKKKRKDGTNNDTSVGWSPIDCLFQPMWSLPDYCWEKTREVCPHTCYSSLCILSPTELSGILMEENRNQSIHGLTSSI